MSTLSDWFMNLNPYLRFYWGIAIFASIVVTIQMVMSFIGMSDIDSGNADVDFSTDTDGLDDAGSMHLLTIRNIFYFLLGFGWAGVSLWSTISNAVLLCIVAVLAGCLFRGFVYLPVPPDDEVAEQRRLQRQRCRWQDVRCLPAHSRQQRGTGQGANQFQRFGARTGRPHCRRTHTFRQ